MRPVEELDPIVKPDGPLLAGDDDPRLRGVVLRKRESILGHPNTCSHGRQRSKLDAAPGREICKKPDPALSGAYSRRLGCPDRLPDRAPRPINVPHPSCTIWSSNSRSVRVARCWRPFLVSSAAFGGARTTLFWGSAVSLRRLLWHLQPSLRLLSSPKRPTFPARSSGSTRLADRPDRHWCYHGSPAVETSTHTTTAGAAASANTAGFRVLENERRIVTETTVAHLKDSGASQDLIDAAERAAKTNPS